MSKLNAVLVPEQYQSDIPTDALVLLNKWFLSTSSVIKESGLISESLKSITVIGLFEKVADLRNYFKRIDQLLELNGTLIIDYYDNKNPFSGGHFTRPISFLMNEISLSYGKRYRLIKKENDLDSTRLTYQKTSSILQKSDTLESWTFGIVSDGRKDDRIFEIIKQIESFGIPNYEIIICGPSPAFELTEKLKVLTDHDLYHDIRIPITAKKNRIISNASFNNLVLMHDRISFPASWFIKMQEYGNLFEILAVKILDEDTKKLRVQDWMHCGKGFYNFVDINAGLLEYDRWIPEVYVDGGFLIAKIDTLKSIGGYNEALAWGEAEDVDLSIRLNNAGFLINIDTDNCVFTQTHRHSGVDNNTRFKKINFLREIYRKIKKNRFLIKEKQKFNDYLDVTFKGLKNRRVN